MLQAPLPSNISFQLQQGLIRVPPVVEGSARLQKHFISLVTESAANLL